MPVNQLSPGEVLAFVQFRVRQIACKPVYSKCVVYSVMVFRHVFLEVF